MREREPIVLATRNPHKIEKLRWIIGGFFSRFIELGPEFDIEETRETFKETAEIKALTAAEIYDQTAIATDGGILIPHLRDWNALLTKRFTGIVNITDFDRMDMLLDLMRDKKGRERTIQWREAIAIASPQKVLFSKEVLGDKGLLQHSYDRSQYKEGIWLCSLTCYPQFGYKNFFELTDEELKEGEVSWYKLRRAVRKFLNNSDLSELHKTSKM